VVLNVIGCRVYLQFLHSRILHKKTPLKFKKKKLEAAPIKSHMEKRPGACPASLATTDSIIAGITGQNVLKYLLGFGEVAFLLQYNAITNEFLSHMTYPDPRKAAAGAPPQ